MASTRKLADLVAKDDRFEAWGEPVTGVFVWRPRGIDPQLLRAALQDAWVSLTEIDGAVWLRSVPANPNADPDGVFRAVVNALEHVTG